MLKSASGGLQPGRNLSDVNDARQSLINLNGLPGGIISLTGRNAAFQTQIPAGAVIQQIIINNTTANAVTGGLKIGTSNGGVDVLAALTIGGNFLGHVLDAALLKRIFSKTVAQTLYADAVVAWNGASLDVQIAYLLLS